MASVQSLSLKNHSTKLYTVQHSTVPNGQNTFFFAWGPTVLGRVPWSLVWWWSMHAFNHPRIYAHFVSSGHWWGWNKSEEEKFPERIVQVCLLIWSYFMNRRSLLKSELSRTFEPYLGTVAHIVIECGYVVAIWLVLNHFLPLKSTKIAASITIIIVPMNDGWVNMDTFYIFERFHK